MITCSQTIKPFGVWSLLAGCALASGAALAAPIDVAQLYGSATANSWFSTSFPSNAIDGNNLTIWNAGDHGSLHHPNWLVIDLGMPYLVERIDLYFQQPDGHWAGFSNDYRLYHGLTNTAWTLIGSGTFIDENLAQISAEYLFGAGQSMRFVMYEVIGGTHWSNIAEISVWSAGQQPPIAVPEPATLALMMAGLLGLGWYGRQRGAGRPAR